MHSAAIQLNARAQQGGATGHLSASKATDRRHPPEETPPRQQTVPAAPSRPGREVGMPRTVARIGMDLPMITG